MSVNFRMSYPFAGRCRRGPAVGGMFTNIMWGQIIYER